jgi:hypothetical protein
MKHDNADAGTSSKPADISIEPLGAFVLKGVSRSSDAETIVVLFVQPVEQYRSVIHGLVWGAISDDLRLTVLRHHNAEMKHVRDTLEDNARFALDMKLPAVGPAARYRQAMAGRFNYGVIA